MFRLHRRLKSSRLMSSRIRYFLILILLNVVYQKQTQIKSSNYYYNR
jgi:hypothetical protein